MSINHDPHKRQPSLALPASLSFLFNIWRGVPASHGIIVWLKILHRRICRDTATETSQNPQSIPDLAVWHIPADRNCMSTHMQLLQRLEWGTEPNVMIEMCTQCPGHAATEWDIDASKADSKTEQLTFHHLIRCLVGGCQVAVKHYQDSEDNCCYCQAHARPQQNKGPQSRVVPTLCLHHSSANIVLAPLTLQPGLTQG